ncbi:MAG: trigger factor [Clostridia bacterium]|nr:trigger factor [Clostridia bacterium]
MSNEEQVINAVDNQQENTVAKDLVLNIRGTDYPISYTVEQADKFTKHYVVKVDGEFYKALELSAYFKTKGKYMIPGFRKGKATMASIKTHYGETVFLDATIDEAIDQIYKVMLRPVFYADGMVCAPSVDVKSINLGEFEFFYIITSYAEVENVVYKDLEYVAVKEDKYVESIAQDKLQSALDKAGYWEDISDRALQMKDTATIDFEGRIDGELFEGGSAKDTELEIGSGKFIPGFEEQLVGMNIGETKDINVRFPDDYGAKEFAGKDAVFTVTLSAIKVKKTPELDDEFAKDVSDFDTLDELKASYQKEAEEESASKAKKETENNIIAAVLKANDSYELPEKAVKEMAEKRFEDFAAYLKNGGMNMDMYLGYIGQTKEDMIETYKKDVEASEKRNMILTAVIEAEGIKIEEEEAEAKIKENAEKAGKELEEYRKEMKGDELDYIYNQLLSDKLVSRLKELNKAIAE